jgi:anti-anti-sigma factor
MTLPNLAMPCPDCGYYLWCLSRIVDDVVVLDVFPDRMPHQADIQRLATSLADSNDAPRVIVDLSRLDRINSLLMAKLLGLKRCISHAQGALILCGMGPCVRQTFVSTKLDTLFEIADGEDTALADLLSGNPA